MSGNELTEKDKEILIQAMGEGMGKAYKEMKEDMQRIGDARYELTQKKLDVLDEKMERLLNYPQKNKIILDKILEIVENLKS